MVPLNENNLNNRGVLRWPIFALGLILLLISLVKGEVKEATFSFILGCFGGFCLDYLGVAKLKLWIYTKQEFLSKEYFSIVVSAWGILAMAINLVWNWISLSEIKAFFLITLWLFVLHEIPNLKTESWKYFVPMKVVIAGWFPLILCFRTIFMLLFPLL